MRTRAAVLSLAVAAISLAAVNEAPAQAQSRAIQPGVMKLENTFSASGSFSGSLAGTILLNNMPYRVAPNASVYIVGQGPGSRSTILNGQTVFLSGDQVGNVRLVRSIIVSPAMKRDEASSGADAGVGVLPANAAR